MPSPRHPSAFCPVARATLSFALALLPVLAGAASAQSKPPAYDTVVRNGTIYDGSGAAATRGDVAIKGDRIVYVGPHAPHRGRTEINVHGKAIAPGFIKSKMTDKLPPDLVEKMKERIGLRRLGEPQDVANVAVFLASEASAYVTGQTIVVDGGLVI